MSVYIGKLALGVDIRHYGDGNPGASNVFRAGGKGWGVMALLLDFLKGAAPVAVAPLFSPLNEFLARGAQLRYAWGIMIFLTGFNGQIVRTSSLGCFTLRSLQRALVKNVM